MKTLLLIALLTNLTFLSKAQQFDTTVYYGCHIKNDTATYVGSLVKQKQPDCAIYSWPKFPGGDKAWNRFLVTHLRWPDSMYDGQGKVFVTFVVEKNGSLSNINIVSAATPEFAMEALRAIKISPKWIPAKINGKPVRNRYTVPVSFVYR